MKNCHTKQKLKSIDANSTILKYILEYLPAHIYWKDKDGVYLGCNDQQAQSLGFKSGSEIVGKTDYELPWGKNRADIFRKNDLEVMYTGVEHTVEESAIFNGKPSIVLSQKIPLKNDKSDIIGILGISIDITDHKKAESLQLESESQKAHIEEQEKFAQVASQASHDMRSPLFSLDMMSREFKEFLPENLRIRFNTQVDKLQAICYRLLLYYKQEQLAEREQKQAIIISLELLQALSEKMYQYEKDGINFRHEFAPGSDVVCIEAIPSDIFRMMSNLLNNAAQAVMGGKLPEIVVKLVPDDKQVEIIIEDNGKGMSEAVLKKLRNNIAVTDGKVDGHGYGMMQVRGALEKNNGKIEINSEVEKGTTITLTFPKIPTPNWLAQEITVREGDTIVILDDDPSIHEVWDSVFEGYRGTLNINHFTISEEAIDFINSSKIDKERIILLTDYELVSQNLNGLDVIEQTNETRRASVACEVEEPAVAAAFLQNGMP